MWTEQQINNLKRRQNDPLLHPYTCPQCSEVLDPTVYGWVCKEHGLVQNWAHIDDLLGEFDNHSNDIRNTLYG